jgi:hypothetical protein
MIYEQTTTASGDYVLAYYYRGIKIEVFSSDNDRLERFFELQDRLRAQKQEDESIGSEHWKSEWGFLSMG